MKPEDFSSYVGGAQLDSLHYRSSDNTFSDLSGRNNRWKLNYGVPTFQVNNGLEGMVFDGTQFLTADNLAFGEMTIIVIHKYDGVGADGRLTLVATPGGVGTTSWRINAWRLSVASQTQRIMYSGVGTLSNEGQQSVVELVTGSVHVSDAKVVCSVNDGVPKSGQAGYTVDNPSITEPVVSIGAYKGGEILNNGWIHKVLIFNEDLHLRKPSELTSLIASEMQLAGVV